MSSFRSNKEHQFEECKLVLSKLKVTDAGLLKRAGIMNGTVSQCENRIRNLINSYEDGIFSWGVFDRESKTYIALVKVTVQNGKNAVIGIEIGEKTLSDNEMYSVMDQVLFKCFYKYELHKISVTVYENSVISENVINELGFVQEAVLHSEIRVGNDYVDAGLFYITAPLYKGYNICFVPYRRGILLVYGTDTYVDRIDFARYGEEVPDGVVREIAYYMGIIDEENKYLPISSPEYDYDVEDLDFIPQELQRAFTELKEYFIKHRENFDINVIFPDGTEFQHEVWSALKEIPYGVTWSYYDLALKISGDKNKAAKLTRAVGAACSENPIPVIIPCHRVIGKDGKLVGFAGGIDIKNYLLQLETFPFMMI